MRRISQILYNIYALALLLIYGTTIVYCSVHNYYLDSRVPFITQLIILLLTFACYLLIESKVGMVCSAIVLIIQIVYYIFVAQLVIPILLLTYFLIKNKSTKKKVLIVLVIVLLYVLLFQVVMFSLEGYFYIYEKTESILSPNGKSAVFYTEFYSIGRLQRGSFLSYGANDCLDLVLLRVWRSRDIQLQTFENIPLEDIMIEWKNDSEVYLNGILYAID